MVRRYRRQIIFGFSLLLAIYLIIPADSVMAQSPKTDQTGKPADNLTPEEIDSHVAGMTDEQIRQAYAEILKQDASARTSATAQASGKGTWQDISAHFYSAARSAKAVLKRVGNFISGETKSEGQWQDAIVKLTGGNGGGHLVVTLIGLIVIIAIGLAVRWLFRRGTADIQER
jgi:hypothetical protein